MEGCATIPSIFHWKINDVEREIANDAIEEAWNGIGNDAARLVVVRLLFSAHDSKRTTARVSLPILNNPPAMATAKGETA